MPAKLSKSSRYGKKSRSNPKSKKSCDNAKMNWVSRHKSKSAKGRKIMVTEIKAQSR